MLVAITYAGLAGAGTFGKRAGGAPTAQGPTPTPSGLVLSTRAANEKVFSLPSKAPGVMWPGIDPSGNVWFGEMTTNHLARLDPKTGAVTEWTPPHGRYGIMQVLADGNGNIWYAEDGANYIGRFDPTTQQFTDYPLQALPNGRQVGPYAMQFDPSGKIWFTGVNGGVIGQFDPATGHVRTWQVPSPDGTTAASPDCIAVTNGKVWFGTVAGGQIGYFDMNTQQFTMYHVTQRNAIIFGMTADPQGRIWFTELQAAYLGEVDPATGKVTTQAVPKISDTSDGLYQIVAASDGALWFPSAGANALVRYVPSSGAYTFYTLTQGESIPYGLTLDGAGNLWFTADGTPNYVAEVTR